MYDPAKLLSGMRILVVDDVGFSLSIVTRMLREMGCEEVVGANGGAQALAILQGAKPPEFDLVVLDHNMPDVDGTTILQLIRSGATGAATDLPVLMLTSSGDVAVVKAAFGLRVDAYVMKPISKNVLGSRILKIMSGRTIDRPKSFDLPPESEPVEQPALELPVATEVKRLDYVAPRLSPPASHFDSFEALVEAAIMRRVDQLLVFFQRHNPNIIRELPPIFLASPAFAEKFRTTIKMLVFPALWKGRQLRQQAANMDVGGVTAETFWEQAGDVLCDAIQSNWSEAWDEFRLVEGRDAHGRRVFKIRESTKLLRQLLPSDEDPSYDQPRIGNREIALFKSLLDTRNDWWDQLHTAWELLQDLYEQEMDPRAFQDAAREGAFRDGLLGAFQRFPAEWMDIMVLTCHRVFPRVSTLFLERFTTNFGHSARERAFRLPYTTRYLEQAAERPEIRQREQAEMARLRRQNEVDSSRQSA